jgi:hypothetical protein
MTDARFFTTTKGGGGVFHAGRSQWLPCDMAFFVSFVIFCGIEQKDDRGFAQSLKTEYT